MVRLYQIALYVFASIGIVTVIGGLALAVLTTIARRSLEAGEDG